MEKMINLSHKIIYLINFNIKNLKVQKNIMKNFIKKQKLLNHLFVVGYN